MFSAFQAQGFTTNKDLCRFVEHDYSTNAVPGSGDDGTREIQRPRRTVEYLLGQEVSRSYFIALPGEWREIRCPGTGAPWDASTNLVTITKVFTNGFHKNTPRSILYPNGTIDIFEYHLLNNEATNIVLHGHPDSSGTNIDQGTRTVSIYNTGKLVSRTTTDVASGIILSRETFSYDGLSRLTTTTQSDGTATTLTYDCCGISSRTEVDGSVATYTYDALRRPLTTSYGGVTSSNVHDAFGNVLQTVRFGASGSPITNFTAFFDDAARQIRRDDALGNSTFYTNYLDGSGQEVRKTTYANGATRTETYFKDGAIQNIDGSAVFPARFEYGPTNQGSYTKEIKLETNGTDLAEVQIKISDAMGRPTQTIYADGKSRQTHYNTNGQLAKMLDPDGVTSLYQYDVARASRVHRSGLGARWGD